MDKSKEYKRDQSVDSIIYGFIIALGILSFISLSVFSMIFAFIVYCATLGDYQLWISRFGYTKAFYGLSLTFILIVIIIFAALLMNSCLGARDGLSFQNRSILITSAVILGVYLINLILTIRVYLLCTNLFTPIINPLPSMDVYGGGSMYRRAVRKSTHEVTVAETKRAKTGVEFPVL